MSSVERKGDTMYELVVNMVKEIRFLKAFYPNKEDAGAGAEPESEPEKLKEEVFSESSKSVPEKLPENMKVDPISYFIRETSGKIVVSDDSDSESGSDLESGESESDSESESEPQDETEQPIPLKNIGDNVHLDIEIEQVEHESPEENESPEEVVEAVDISLQSEVLLEEPELQQEEDTIELLQQEESSSEDEAIPVYTIENLRKMNINQLKSIAISSGISVDTSKMKKNELIQLLQKKDE